MKTLLRNLKVRRVDLVKDGANQEDEEGSHVLLFKRAPEGGKPPNKEWKMKDLKDMTPEELVKHAEKLDAARQELAEDLSKAQDALEEKGQEVTDLTKSVKTLEEKVTELEKGADEGGGGGGDEGKDDILKGVSEEVRKQFDAMREEAEAEKEELKKALQTERDARLNREYLEKAAPLKAVPLTVEDLAKALRAIEENLEEETASQVVKALTEMSEAIETADLLKSMGRASAQEEELGGWDKIQKAAQERVEKDGGKMSLEEAVAQVSKEHPDWVREARG